MIMSPRIDARRLETVLLRCGGQMAMVMLLRNFFKFEMFHGKNGQLFISRITSIGRELRIYTFIFRT